MSYITKVPLSIRWIISTTDDWYPCFEGNKVQVSVHELVCGRNEDGFIIDNIRICVWGADDCGMELDRSTELISFAEALVEAKCLPNPITKDWLYRHYYDRA